MQKRILMIAGAGFVTSDLFIGSMTRELKKCGKYSFSALGVGQGDSRLGRCESDLFGKVDPFPAPEIQPKTLRAAGRLLTDAMRSCVPLRWRWPRRDVVLPYEGRTFRGKVYERLAAEEYARQLPGLLEGYDLYHWHSFVPARLPALRFFPRTCKVIISLWGSDLLRTAGVGAYRIQLQACRRATRIIVNSLEMREVFLAKFGREFFDKVRLARIGGDLFDRIDAVRGDRDSFLRRHQLPLDKVLVCVGNNASPSNRHLDVLRAIARLEARHRDRLVVVLPMTYAAKEAYTNELQRAIKDMAVDVRMLERPLTDDDIARFRISTDIMIAVPTSDMLSASMCEAVYAGGVLLTGAWLLYGWLRRRGIHYHEVADLAGITDKLAAILDNFEEEKRKSAATADRVRDLKAWDRVVADWVEIYDELL
jgi:glycosyltransferase involved in cell wall biosynthesis